jgi:hypothetical protein
LQQLALPPPSKRKERVWDQIEVPRGMMEQPWEIPPRLWKANASARLLTTATSKSSPSHEASIIVAVVAALYDEEAKQF